jgi:dihydroorotate dehydrogenase
MSFYRHILRPLLFNYDPEKCHDAAIFSLEMAPRIPLACSLLGVGRHFSDPRLETDVCGLHFKNPVGLAAGFDKSGRAIEGLAALGFGHIEIGSVSANPSQGNPKPRLFRLISDRAILVHYGLPNDGAEIIAKRLSIKHSTVPIGINIVKTNRGMDAPPESDDEIIEDYLRSVRRLKESGAYLALNLSCPNTAHGRDFFAVSGNTRRLLMELEKLNVKVSVFLKVSAAGGPQRLDNLLEEVDGLSIVSGFELNLTSEKPQNLSTPRHLWESRKGAVSGKPIEAMMNEAIRNLHARIDRKRYQIIGAGGIFCAEDAYLKIRLGASLIQILTVLIYEGPGVVSAINRGLSRLLQRDGFRNVSEAVGTLNRIPG